MNSSVLPSVLERESDSSSRWNSPDSRNYHGSSQFNHNADPSLHRSSSENQARMEIRVEHLHEDHSRGTGCDWKLIRKRLFAAPVLRQVWGMEQDSDKVAWFELFYDLMFVALAINLSDFLKENLDIIGVLTAILFFTVFWSCWYDLTIFSSRFYNDDMFSTGFKFLYVFGVVGMSVFMKHGLDDRRYFSLFVSLSKFCLCVLYLQVFGMVPRARNFAFIAFLGEFTSFLSFLYASFTDDIRTTALWLLAIPISISWSKIAHAYRSSSIPVNIQHFAERNGLFIMLMLGESIIALLSTTKIGNLEGLSVVFFGFFMVYCLKVLYYGAQPHEPELHALRHGNYRSYIFANFLIGLCLLGVGAALKLHNIHSLYKVTPFDEFLLLSWSLGCFFIGLNCHRVVHKFKARSRLVWAWRVVFISFFFAFPFFPIKSTPPITVFLCSLVVGGLSVTDFFARDRPPIHRHLAWLNDAPVEESKIQEHLEAKKAEHHQRKHFNFRALHLNYGALHHQSSVDSSEDRADDHVERHHFRLGIHAPHWHLPHPLHRTVSLKEDRSDLKKSGTKIPNQSENQGLSNKKGHLASSGSLSAALHDHKNTSDILMEHYLHSSDSHFPVLRPLQRGHAVSMGNHPVDENSQSNSLVDVKLMDGTTRRVLKRHSYAFDHAPI